MKERLRVWRARAAPGSPGRRHRRRGVGLGVALAAASMGFGSTGAAAHESGVLPEGDWSEEQRAYAEDLVHRTEQALPAFADPDALAGQGYANFGATAPGGYDHWTSVAQIVDPRILDPAAPEALVFQRTPGGGQELVAAMFFLPPQYTMDTIPEDIAWLPGWHVHAELCSNGSTFTGFVRDDGTCEVGAPILIPMMHVWLKDPGCGHLFAGIGVTGLMCDVEGHPGGMDHGPDHGPDGGMDDGMDDAPPPAQLPAATPVQAVPNFTG